MAISETGFFELNTGTKIPSIGLGTWQSHPSIIGVTTGIQTWSSPPHLVGQAVTSAVKVGYRHIDCAPIYGNQKEIGFALKKLFEDGVVKREEMFITSKLWHTEHEPEEVPLALEETLQDLQLDYLDGYFVRLVKGNFLIGEKSPYKTVEDLWDGDV